VLFFDLDFADVARVLDDLGDVGLVPAPDFTRDALGKVREASDKPVLVENADAVAVGCTIILDHAEFAVDRPKDEEDDEHVMRIPKPFIVRPARLLDGRQDHGHERDQHEVARPTGPRDELGQDEADEAKLPFGRQLGIVVPVRKRVDPGEEKNRPGDQLVEGDVLVELDDPVQGRLAGQRDERSADGEQDEGDVDVEHQGGRSGNHVRGPKY